MTDEIKELTFDDLLRMLRRGWLAILITASVCGLISAAIAHLSDPVYRAEALLAPSAAETGGNSALSRLAGEFAPLAGIGGLDAGGGLEDKEVRLATLRSRRLTERFIADRNLLSALFPEQWDRTAGRWKLRDGKPAVPSIGDAVELFDKRIRRASEDKRTGLVTLAIEWSDPQAAADWANSLIRRANEFMRVRAIEEAKRSIEFLEKELSKTNVLERQQIIYRLIESRTGEIMMANAREEYAFIIVDPAVAPEAHNFVRPKRAMIILTGIIFGLIAGSIFVIGRQARILSSTACSDRQSSARSKTA